MQMIEQELSFTYQYNEGLDYTASDGGSDELEFAGHYYLEVQK